MWTKELFERKSSRGTLFMSFDVVAKTKQTSSQNNCACKAWILPKWTLPLFLVKKTDDMMKKAIVQKRQITLLRKKVERIMAKSEICLKTCSMMMKQVPRDEELVKLLRSNFGISIKLLKAARQARHKFRNFSFCAHGANQKTTWVLEWFPYVERVFLRIVGGKT